MNWEDRIKRARKLRKFNDEDKLKAEGWATCAVGEFHFEKTNDPKFRDSKLYSLGICFAEMVMNDSLVAVEALYEEIRSFNSDSKVMTIIYIGSLYHEYCDPFLGVIGLDENKVEKTLKELADQEYSTMRVEFLCPEHESNRCDCTPNDDICTTDIFEESLDNIHQFMDFYPPQMVEQLLAELHQHGYIVI